MTFPQVGRADPGHHQHQAGQVRAVVDRQLIHHQAGHVVHPIVVCQLDSTIFNWVAIWPRLLRETRLQLSKPVRWGFFEEHNVQKWGPADVPDDGEEDDRDDVDGAGQLPQPVVWVDHRDVTLNLSIITIIIIMTITVIINIAVLFNIILR